ncbi:hypothetical protein RND81_08G004600 [Saponaria officinalis]|uniref:GBF-interacting protein 1 N-terminal domain-containing protein n=1 Tax=Saponaria officinalis TaxID=3572 RepID=A0AAW1J1G9_SAPOF
MGSSGRGGRTMNNNNNINNNGGFNQIPASSKKVIQSIKEIVNFPEDEIYFMLKDCNMDPYEAVNRLLSQDTFHEVKSKREKKKEVKDVMDSRPRGNSSTSTRGSRGGGDRYSSRSSTNQFVSSDNTGQYGKPAYKKEIGPPVFRNPPMGVAGNNTNSWQTHAGTYSVNAAASILPTPQPSGFQSPWSGMPGHVSMADIVKKGRPLAKAPQQHINNQHAMPPLPAASAPYDSRASQNYASKVAEVEQASGVAGHQSAPSNDDWPLDEEPAAASASNLIEPPVDSEPYNDAYDVPKQQYMSQVDDVTYDEDGTADDEHAKFAGSVPGSNQNSLENDAATASGFDNDLYQNIGSYQAHHHEVEDPNVSVSSMTNNFESLSFPKDEEETQSEDEDAQSEDDGPAVKIPEHLQVQTTSLSHLSFGSFGSGMSAPFSGSFDSRPAHSNEEQLQEAVAATDAPSVGHSEARNPEYYDDEHLRTRQDEDNAHRMGAGSGNFEAPTAPQADMLQQEVPEAAQPNQYSFPSSTANYTYDNSQQLNSSFAHQPTSSQMMQGLPSLAGVNPYSNSLPSALLASNMQQLREAELAAYSQFPTSQSMAAKYGNNVSSLSGPTASMAEALRTGNLAAQPTQTVPGGNVSGPTGLPQHLAMHPYSQHSVPLGPLNMMGYPFLPQTYTYMPSAFQQAFATGNSAYPQSLAAAGFPQFKNSVSVNSLPQSGAVPSGYGGFGNSNNNIPSDFPLNPPSAPPGNSMNYEDVLTSQYKDASHLLSLQQGAGSRTMSGVPGNTYYSFQGQNQQQQQQQQQQQAPAGFRQSQQQQPPSQHYGPLSGYPNYYHSQAGLSLDHQQQMSRDGSLGGSQGQPPKQTQQHLWQNNY